MTKVKICGIRREEDVNALNKYMPDYAGFVFAKSKRQVSRKEASKFAFRMNKNIVRVGVFVDEDVEDVASLINDNIIQIPQLHGQEDASYINNLRKLCNRQIEVMKAIRVKNEEDILRASSYPCEYLLFDAFSSKAAGGNGVTFDWSMIREVKKPFFLAGGISIENVATAINLVHPYAVDVSSSLEENGFKSSVKIQKFMELIKGSSI